MTHHCTSFVPSIFLHGVKCIDLYPLRPLRPFQFAETTPRISSDSTAYGYTKATSAVAVPGGTLVTVPLGCHTSDAAVLDGAIQETRFTGSTEYDLATQCRVDPAAYNEPNSHLGAHRRCARRVPYL